MLVSSKVMQFFPQFFAQTILFFFLNVESRVSFFDWRPTILRSSFQKNPQSCSNYPSLKVLENTLKIRIKQTPVLFCKYLRNESSDLHEILWGGHSLCCELKLKVKMKKYVFCIFSPIWASKTFKDG